MTAIYDRWISADVVERVDEKGDVIVRYRLVTDDALDPSYAVLPDPSPISVEATPLIQGG
jgi:hypothetical protein